MRTSCLGLIAIILGSTAGLAQSEPVHVELSQAFTGQQGGFLAASPGDLVRLEISAGNVGQAPGTGVVARYEWPSGLDFIDVISMPAAAVHLDPERGVLEWYIGDLFPQRAGAIPESSTLVLLGRVNEAAAGQLLQGTLSAFSTDGDIATSAGPTPAVAVAGQATVDLAASATGSFSRAGRFYSVRYDVTVSNAGPDLAATSFLQLEINPVVLDQIEDGTITGPANTQCDIDQLTCLITDLAAGASVEFTAIASVHVDEAPTNIAIDFVAIANDADSDLSNNRAFGNVSLPEPTGGGGSGGGGMSGLLFIGFLLLLTLSRLRKEPS